MKRIFCVLLTLILLTFSLPVAVVAENECEIDNNIIDITDKAVYQYSSLGSAKVTNIKISGAQVVRATEENQTINIFLDGNTPNDAEISIEFGTALDRNMNISGHTAQAVLGGGEASVSMTLKGQYSSFGRFSGTMTFTLIFSIEKPSVAPPTRLAEQADKTTYSGVALDLNLKEYFDDAKNYYLVDGEEKTPIDGKIYTFKTFEGGTHTLVFGASNDNGDCPDLLTVTIEVTEIISGAWLGIETSNGSVNFVLFSDSDGNSIEGLEASLEDKNISVKLPRTFDADGKITATFDLTQNGGLPKLSTSNAFNGSNDTKVFTTTLSSGTGKRTMYLYNAHPKATSNNYTTYTITYAIENQVPTLAKNASSSENAEIVSGESFALDLSPVFMDADGDELSYIVKMNGEDAISCEANFNFTPTLGGTYELEFFASDFMSTSVDSYKVTLSVSNSKTTYDTTVFVPDDITPLFYITNGFDENGIDFMGDELSSLKGESADGYTAYIVSVPENISLISVRDNTCGGLAFSVSSESTAKLCNVQTEIIDFGNNVIAGEMTVSYGEKTAIGNTGKFLLVPDTEYTFTASPENTSVYSPKTEKFIITEDSSKVTVKVQYKNPKTVITTTGAVAKLFSYKNNYFVHTVYTPLTTVDNENGTSTHYFAAEGDLSFRVSMDGKLTKAGYMKIGNSATVLHTENDALPTERQDYFTSTSDSAIVGDDSILLNINKYNHLLMNIGDEKTLKAYRTWQIIDLTYNNHIIEPDFHFNILSGEDVISLEPVENQPATNGSGNWRKLSAIGEGTAIVEVTYDAISISGSSFDGLYGATDPARSGLFVVTVGGDAPEVDFGIESKSSYGSMVYSEANKKPWDSEFDTLYFLGDSGEIKLSPTAKDNGITEVSVSNDKGKTYTVLDCSDGSYTAPIVSGNNIIRVTTDKGVAYQIVRGDKVELSVKNITDPGKPISAGDEVSITLIGVHTPVSKIAGTYNPGYKSNTDGDGGIHLRYSFGDKTARSDGKQYNFSKEGTTIKLEIPENSEETQFTLTDGYIGLGVIGVTGYSDNGDSHRNIPDGGGITRDNKTTYTTRSILPDITLSIGMLPSGNTAPYIRENAPKSATLNLGRTYAVSMSKIFTDRDNDTLSYIAKVNESEETTIDDGYFTFTPDEPGTYTLAFAAKDSETESDTHTITLTVKEKSNSSSTSSPKYDISGDEIEGYVYVSFVDNGKRVEGESNITYPKALGTIISSKKVPFAKGDTVADVTLRLLDAYGFTYQHTGTTKDGFYLASIGSFTHKGIDYDSFGEFDAGSGSGWMITLNKEFIRYGASDFVVKNADTVKWQYTCQLGEDIGDTFGSEANFSFIQQTTVKKDEETKEEIKEEIIENEFSDDTFHDVKKGDWHYDYVKYVYENNLMQGTENGFEPDSKMTRAMLVTVIYRMAKAEKIETSHNFDDVPENAWYCYAVAWAASNGIINGISETEFAPDEYVTREQMAVILRRFAKINGMDVSEIADISKFSDADDISNFAIDAMKWAYKTELINGTSETELSPKDVSTRAQVAAVLTRFCENSAK